MADTGCTVMGNELGAIWSTNGATWSFRGMRGHFRQATTDNHNYTAGDLMISIDDKESLMPCPAEMVSRQPCKFLFEDDGHVYVSGQGGLGHMEVLNPHNLDLEPDCGVIVANGLVIEKIAPEGAVRGFLEPPSPTESLSKLKIDHGSITDADCRFAGYEPEVERCRRVATQALAEDSPFESFGFRPPQGILLLGPPGTGKTTLARKIAKEMEANLYLIRGPEILSQWVGNSEKLLRAVFDDAKGHRSIIFFDEIDALAIERASTSQSHTAQLVAQMLSLMDGFSPDSQRLIIGTTNRPQSIDEAFMRPGRLDAQITLGAPELSDRIAIIKTHIKENAPGGLDMEHLGIQTKGWSGADLYSMIRYAIALAADDGRTNLWLTDFHDALAHVQAIRKAKPARGRQ